MKLTTINALTVDWSIREEKLYATVCGGYPINVCAYCGSDLHISNMCSKHVESALKFNYVNNSASNAYCIGTDTNQSTGVNSVDTYGRPKLL